MQRTIILSLLAAFVAFVTWFPITDTDIWWHLAAAREMFARKEFLFTDPFAYTLDNPLWINLHWLFQLAAYTIYTHTGAIGLVVAKCGCTTLACVILCGIFPTKRYVAVSALMCALLLYEARYLVLERPVIVTLLCMSLFFYLLERYLSTHQRKNLVWLFILQLIWTNSQGLFALGPAIVLLYAAGGVLEKQNGCRLRTGMRAALSCIDKNLFVVALLLPVVSLINPNGLSALSVPHKLFTRLLPVAGNAYSWFVAENVPVFALQGADRHFLFSFVVLTIVTVLSFVVNRTHYAWRYVLLVVTFCMLAMMAQRNILLFFFVCIPVVGYNISVSGMWSAVGRMPARIRLTVVISLTIAMCMVLLSAIVNHARVVAVYPTAEAVSPFRVPVAAAEYLQRNPVEGALFNADRYGGYLLWKLYPSKKVYIDGRFTLRPPQFLNEYLAILQNPQLFDSVATRFGITHAILPTAVYYQYMGLVKYLYESEFWKLVFVDGGSVLFVRNEMTDTPRLSLAKAEDVQIVQKEISRQWHRDPYIESEANNYLKNLCRFLSVAAE